MQNVSLFSSALRHKQQRLRHTAHRCISLLHHARFHCPPLHSVREINILIFQPESKTAATPSLEEELAPTCPPTPPPSRAQPDHVARGRNYLHEPEARPQELLPRAGHKNHRRNSAATIAHRTAAGGERAVLRLLIKSWTIADFPSTFF